MNAVTEVMDELRKALSELEDCRARNADLRTMLEQTARALNHAEEAMVRLETQRDEARAALATCPDCVMYAKRSARFAEQADQLQRERDAARAELAKLREDYDSVLEANVSLLDGAPYVTARDAIRERDEARAEVERLRELKDYLRTWLSSEELEGLRVKAAEHPLLWQEIHHLKAEVERLREMAHDFEAMREDRDAAIARITEVGVMVATNGNALAKDAFRRGAEAMREACIGYAHKIGFHGLTVDIRALPIPEEP